MPEGDTIFRAAARLRPVLEGHEVRRLEAPRASGPRPPIDTTVESVEAVGKHLLITFGDGIVLRTHMRMSGSWHLYRTGERWQKPAHLMRALVEVDGWVAVCFSAPVVEFERTPAVGHLGPDLCRPDADLDECVARMGTLADPTTEVADVLLDQRIACGVGNVYKSEVCWACRVSPRTPIAEIDLATRRALVETATRQLRANLGGGARQTVSGSPGAIAVYGRAGRPCRRCGTPIRFARTGPHARGTYWCPTCQPPPPPSPPASR
ncbi:MAG: DNA-formamidopyrimidine glycosylase family protein [Acidimicrobiales bacterium]